MRHRSLVTVAVGAIFVLAACSGGGASIAPTSAPSAAASVEASMEASAPAGEASAPAAGAACAESSGAGEVTVTIANFAFDPPEVTATVGQTITFTNSDSAPHTATLDDNTCTTPKIAQGGSNGLTFSAAGTYPFHCAIHPNMMGTITVR